MHSYLAGLSGPIAFAHRGGAAHGAENTMVTFARAVDLGYRYLETDVRCTSDGVAVVFHDADTRRLTGVPGLISRRSFAYVRRRLRVDGQPVPSLAEALAAWPHARWNIDVKSEAAIAATLRSVDEMGAADRVLLSTYSGPRLQRIRQAAPHIATSLTPREVAALRMRGKKPVAGLAAQVPMRYGPVTVVTPRFVEAAHTAGVRVHVWTIDDPAEMRVLLDLGVDGIMTDRIDILKDVYRERGLWTDPL